MTVTLMVKQRTLEAHFVVVNTGPVNCAVPYLVGSRTEHGGMAGIVATAPERSKLEAASLKPDSSGLEAESNADVRSIPVRADAEVLCKVDGGLLCVSATALVHGYETVCVDCRTLEVCLATLLDTVPYTAPTYFGLCIDSGTPAAPEKEAKRQTVVKIVEYVNNARNCFNGSLMQNVVRMVGANIGRALQTRHRDSLAFADPEGDEPSLEKAWPHWQIVYEFFLCFVVSNDVDPKIAKRVADQNVVLKLLELFDSEDPRERDYPKTMLHRFYGKFLAPELHPQCHPTRRRQVHLRMRDAQRSGRVARDFGQHYRRLCGATEGGA